MPDGNCLCYCPETDARMEAEKEAKIEKKLLAFRNRLAFGLYSPTLGLWIRANI